MISRLGRGRGGDETSAGEAPGTGGSAGSTGLDGNEAGGGGGAMNAFVPAPVVGIDDAVHVACGSTHSCALLEDGSVRCWGSNASEQLGVPDIAQGRTPVVVTVF